MEIILNAFLKLFYVIFSAFFSNGLLKELHLLAADKEQILHRCRRKA